MKRFILITLFLSLPATGALAEDCTELGEIIQTLEDETQRTFINNCSSQNSDSKYFKEWRCSDLGTIEIELEKKKMELMVSEGFEKLKNAIQKSKEEVKDKDNKTAGKDFIANLNLAHSFEVLINSKVNDKSLIENLDITETTNLQEFKNIINEKCKNSTNNKACDFNYTEEFLTELKALLPTKPEIQTLKDNISITKDDGSPYSFEEMKQAIDQVKLNNLTREDLTKIKNLPDFKSKDEFSFVKELSNVKNRPEVLFSQWSYLMEDAAKRMEYEVFHKLSAGVLRYQSELKLDEKEKGLCQKVTSLTEAENCYGTLQKKSTNSSDKNLKTLLGSIKASIDYSKNLTQDKDTCAKSFKQDPTDLKCLTISSAIKRTQEEIEQLNNIKNQIISENKDKLTFRNFALSQWKEKNCGTETSSIDSCENYSNVSKEVFITSSDSLNIIALFTTNKDIDDEAKKVCNSAPNKRSNIESKLCSYLNEKKVVITRSEDDKDDEDLVTYQSDAYQKTMSPQGSRSYDPDKEFRRAMWNQAGGVAKNFLRQAAMSFYNSRMRPSASSPFNYRPYPTQPVPNGNFSFYPNIPDYYHESIQLYSPTPGLRPFRLNAAPSSCSVFFGSC